VVFDSDPDAVAGDAVLSFADYVTDIPDGIVDGTSGDDVIDNTYTDDPQGEVVDGYDSITDPPVDAVSSWQAQGIDEHDVSAGITDTIGGIEVEITFVNDGNAENFTLEHNSQYVNGNPNFDATSGIELRGLGGIGDTSTTTIDFSAVSGSGFREEVENVAFYMNDIDTSSWQDVVAVRAYDADGNLIVGGVNVTIFGNETEAGGIITAGAGNDSETSANGSVLIEIDGPVSYIEIDYDNLGSGGQKLIISDIHFQAIPIGANSDVIDAGAGNDSIDSGVDADTVYGGTGNDTINASADDDTLFGGNDADVFQLGDDLGNDSIVGGEGGTDSDTIDASALTSGVTVTFTGSEAGTLNDGTNTATFSEIENLILTNQADTVNGSAATSAISINAGDGADSVSGGSGNDTLVGGAGDDTLAGGIGGDTLYGGAGMDYADYSTSSAGVSVNLTSGAASGGDATGDVLAGVDGVIGSAFADTITGFNGQGADYTNIFYGGAGNDILTGLGGDDTMFGGDDADTFVLTDGFGTDTISGGEGGTDNDTLNASAMTAGVNVTFSANETGTLTQGGNTANFSQIETVVLTDQADTVNASATTSGVSVDAGGGADSIIGGSGTDSIAGGAGNDTINSGAGNDTVYGGAGNDSIEGGANNDSLYGGADDDLIFGGAGADQIFGGDGNDSVVGGSGYDTIYGGTGIDIITGGNGADLIDGGAGADTIYLGNSDTGYGGDGDDVFIIDEAQNLTGGTTIVGGEGSETGGDTLDFNGQLDKGTLVITNSDDNAGGLTGYAFLLDGTRVDFTEIETIICFARGTKILTHCGEIVIEDLQAGDMIVTLDHGLQQIRWIGSRTVPATGDFAPITITKDVLGNHRDLTVSPQHRMLVSGPVAELLFGESEILVPAKHLLSWDGVYRSQMPEVEYFHMLFDTHQIIHANGAKSESFHPGEQAMDAISKAARAEILSLFPALATEPTAYGPAARFSLKGYEAEVLGQRMA
jgi:Ca2+-binding RTX toxin-like protein